MPQLSGMDIIVLIKLNGGIAFSKLSRIERGEADLEALIKHGYLEKITTSPRTGKRLKTPQYSITSMGRDFVKNLLTSDQQRLLDIAAHLEQLQQLAQEQQERWQRFSTDLSAVKAALDQLAHHRGVGAQVPDEAAFLKVVREEYAKLVQTSPIAPYVPVAYLREFVLSRLNIERTTFDALLVAAASGDPYKVELVTSSGEKGTGVYYGLGECHAVVIR